MAKSKTREIKIDRFEGGWLLAFVWADSNVVVGLSEEDLDRLWDELERVFELEDGGVSPMNRSK